MDALPIDILREDFGNRDPGRPLLVCSPTGSGKSTRVPLWAVDRGPVLVVEPRRVAARALALRVAEETGTEPGELVGWAVRDESVRSASTRILFCTPGVALGMLGSGELAGFATWILDEFHERRADVDALLAWMRAGSTPGKILLLSATLEKSTLAQALGAQVLESEGRGFPVDIEHVPEPGQAGPQEEGLPLRLERALRRLDSSEGTVLCFLPGVAEIAEAHAWLSGRIPARVDRLHGGLALEDQTRVLRPFPGARLVLATNVAESALTVSDVVAVIDPGLERRIVRENGFPRLELGPVSRASADQRAGRAGRVRPGRCLRLWPERARLEARNRPSIQVDDPQDWMLPLLLAGADPRDLPWLDRPRADGLDEAFARFVRLGLWEPDPSEPRGGRPTELARSAASLPLPPDLAGFCLRLSGTAAFRDGASLCAALSAGRPLFPGRASPERMELRASFAGAGGDAALLARCLDLEEDEARSLGAHVGAWREARRGWERLRSELGIGGDGWPVEFQSDAVARALWELEPRSLRRRRGAVGREEYALGDGPGLRPSRQSLSLAQAPELALVLSSHAGIDARGDRRVWAEAAEPLSASRAMRLGIGRPEIVEARVVDGIVRARWVRKVGKEEIGRAEGDATEKDVWIRAVVRAAGPEVLDEIRTRLGWLAREECLRRGAWTRPPEEAAAWLERRLSDQGEPPAFPRIPLPDAPTDRAALERAFPALWSDRGVDWNLDWDVWTGKVRARRADGAKGRTSFRPPSGWDLR
jgi:ATP-dependent helicase HrpB